MRTLTAGTRTTKIRGQRQERRSVKQEGSGRDQETTGTGGRDGKSENVYNCIQKLIDILLWSGIIRKRKAKALEAAAQSVSSGAFFILYCIMSVIS